MHTGVCKHALLTHAVVDGKVGKPQAATMPNLSLWDMTLLLYVATVLRSIRAFSLARALLPPLQMLAHLLLCPTSLVLMGLCSGEGWPCPACLPSHGQAMGLVRAWCMTTSCDSARQTWKVLAEPQPQLLWEEKQVARAEIQARGSDFNLFPRISVCTGGNTWRHLLLAAVQMHLRSLSSHALVTPGAPCLPRRCWTGLAWAFLLLSLLGPIAALSFAEPQQTPPHY